MSKFIVNRPHNFETSVKQIVKQSFPASDSFYIVSDEAMEWNDTIPLDTSIDLHGKNLFLWGSSIIGSSDVVGK